MGQSKISRYIGTLLFASAISCMLGFWWARTSGSESWVIWARGLKWTLIILALCAGYMAAVGLYHTILSARARTGPFSGLPERERAESEVSSKTDPESISTD